MKILMNLFLLSATAAWGQTRPIQLEAVSSNLNAESHQITVTLLNHSNKVVVAYSLSIRQFDASGKPLGQPLLAGSDLVFNLVYADQPNLAAYGFILPGAEIKSAVGSIAVPDATNATADVQAVVYQDKSGEGDPKQIALVFRGRALHARHAAAAVELLSSYPASPTEAQSRLDKLAEINERTGATDQLIRARSPGTLPDRQQWDAAADDAKRLADLLASQSEAIR